jgi:hypothetical protein
VNSFVLYDSWRQFRGVSHFLFDRLRQNHTLSRSLRSFKALTIRQRMIKVKILPKAQKSAKSSLTPTQ